MPVDSKTVNKIVANLQATKVKFADFDECMSEMEGKYDKETAGAVCATICRRTGKMSYGSKILKTKNFSLFVPITKINVVTKSVGELQRGDILVEGYVSKPIKDLQGDVLEESALVEAKDAMIKPPHNLVWLDHESPYADPQTNTNTPPIGKFIYSKIVRLAGIPTLWVRMLVNKAHPKYSQISYELKKGFYNAFSMEFMPVKEAMKVIGGKVANGISSIKYYASSLVRAPANEAATITRVYTKAFTNSSRFTPVQIIGPGWNGQTIKKKGKIENMSNKKLSKKQTEEDKEEEEDKTPAEEKKQVKDEDEEEESVEDRMDKIEKQIKNLVQATDMIGKSLDLDIKGIDEDTEEGYDFAPDAPGSAEIDEDIPPETPTPEAGPIPPQEIIEDDDASPETSDEEITYKNLKKQLPRLIKKEVDRQVRKKIVVRKGFSEYGGPVPESIKRKQLLKQSGDSIEDQLAVIEENRS